MRFAFLFIGPPRPSDCAIHKITINSGGFSYSVVTRGSQLSRDTNSTSGVLVGGDATDCQPESSDITGM